MDIVGFTFHHALSPLLSEEVLRKEIRAHRHIYGQTFGTAPQYSKGYWPAEGAFSERIIKVLEEEGFEWSVVANSHLARTLQDYPLNFGTSGTNYDPPNKADIAPIQGNNWWNGQIDGRGGTFAAPFCYQAHRAKYVDPASGNEYFLTVVPMGDLLSYKDGFSAQGTGDIDAHIAPHNDPAHPSIVLFAHDGDNAWGGGWSYYMEAVPNFVSEANTKGYVPTTIQQFLHDHPVPSGDLVHVEDGSWVNAANDWGHPQFINWMWPLYTVNYTFDPNGWTEDVRNWAVLTAAENHVQMAEDLTGGADIADIVSPGPNSSNAEKAWHFLLPGFTSGYMYYGTAIDMEVKQTLACNHAIQHADNEISQHPGTDNTAPSVFIPQRYPYNPGGTGFGPNYGYQQHQNASDFHVWTLAYDVEGLQSVELKYREDLDGTNPLSTNQNETYAGGPEVDAWNSISMSERVFPKTNVTNNPDISFFILPDQIATLYYAEITGLSETLVDYYVEATDNNGNTFRTPIQHVWIGASNPGGGGNPNVYWEPAQPTLNDTITLYVENATGAAKLHWGVNTWQSPSNAYWHNDSYLFNGSGPAIESAMTGPNSNNQLSIKLGPFNDPGQVVTNVSFVIHYNDNTWDNNNGADYFIPINNNPTSIEEEEAFGANIQLGPNPASGETYVYVSESLSPDEYAVELISTRGQVLSATRLQGPSGNIDLKRFRPGMYFVRVIELTSGKSATKKLVIR